jgi:TetR/AcrR family transcriptional regulator, regulator of cefoperazone and chloramphenicol sensitivity
MAARVPSSDLNGHARIRNAALEAFAREGVKASSVRAIARAAGVSPGLVQHYFPSKDALRDAVNAHVIALAAAHFADLPPTAPGGDPFVALGDRITDLVGAQPDAILYAARAIVEGDAAALELFDGFVTIARAQWDLLADEGLLRSDVDLAWAALHSVIFNLGTVVFRTAIERHLPQPFFTPGELARWNAATTAMMRMGTRAGDEGVGSPTELP